MKEMASFGIPAFDERATVIKKYMLGQCRDNEMMSFVAKTENLMMFYKTVKNMSLVEREINIDISLMTKLSDRTLTAILDDLIVWMRGGE